MIITIMLQSIPTPNDNYLNFISKNNFIMFKTSFYIHPLIHSFIQFFGRNKSEKL